MRLETFDGRVSRIQDFINFYFDELSIVYLLNS